VLPVLRALQGHPEAAKLWEEHISAILNSVGFKNTTHKKNIYTGTFCGEKVLLVCQVDDFALGCCQESTAKSVYAEIGAKLTLHNEADAPFEYLGLVDSFDGYDVLQTRDYIKLSAESYIRRLLKAHGWENPSPRESSNKPKPPLHKSDVVSGPVVRPTDRTHARLITNRYLRMEHGRGRYNGIGMISRGLLNKSSLFRYIILM